jgi:hypothetical protein
MDSNIDNTDTKMLPVYKNSQTKQDLSWDLEEGSFYSLPSDNKPLDWGSNNEKYVLSSLTSTPVYSLTESPQLLSITESKAGSYENAVDMLYNSFCKHGSSFALCIKCKGKHPNKMGTVWLLDSGISAHFTFSKDNFIKYIPASKEEKTPVRTAANVIYIEGKEIVLLYHNIGNQMITTRLYPVLYIPKLITHLLSMRAFLQQGLHVTGNVHQISLNFKCAILMTCKPLINGQTIYWLEADVKYLGVYQLIYLVNYNLMYKCLRHPSKNIMLHTRDKVKEFLDSVKIPSKTPVCPRCA